MSWQPLAERAEALPLILAGPIVRRVEPHSVTIWLALKEARTVTLFVYEPTEEGHTEPRCTGTRQTIRLGDHLHLVAVTARPTDREQPLEWGKLYYYNLFFSEESQATPAAHLGTPGIFSMADEPLSQLTYAGQPLPGFVLPPRELEQVRIIHGSCRKPQAQGYEMLSVLDTLLANAAHDPVRRPQQLFLTGDQIYADDVSAPLLFALMDAGSYLFAGNEPELLQPLQLPAQAFPPEGRTPIVHTVAMFTTTHPENHLLSFAEYAAMYLFSWSDVLWPDELPGTQDLWKAYPEIRPRKASQQEKAERSFKEQYYLIDDFVRGLPAVRRALANIATYMICDDHEVTDDWFLDGAWCRRILKNELGQQIVRNGLLAYALFQGWGNTPEQFEQSCLLSTINRWNGSERAAEVEKINTLLGMPFPFSGKGELRRSKQALDWHYTYNAPAYHVVVLDTRTRRYYRKPSDFPGLLSRSAMHTQLDSALQAQADVTIIISPSPVLGVDFVESIQFWSRLRVRENYAFDREAWALEWETFQNFLKYLSRLQRVVFLSGDVHYAFGASLDYWDHRTHATARFINFTASPLSNEGSGSQMAVLAIGYPRLLQLLRRDSPSVDFFAWDLLPGDSLIANYVLSNIRKRLYHFWWSLPRLIAARRSKREIVLPAHGWHTGSFDAFPPNRSYRLNYLRNSMAQMLPQRKRGVFMTLYRWLLFPLQVALGAVTLLQKALGAARQNLIQANRKAEQKRLTSRALHRPFQDAITRTEKVEQKLEEQRVELVDATFRHKEWFSKWKAGELIVGYNNIGEVFFETAKNRPETEIIQRLWWWTPTTGIPTLQKAEYHASLAPPDPAAEPPLP
uniref:PhoD-like phosphatase metallophosphatase domain-containing protein n=1 Tax=Thermosporothrix sp. COM3 TaxID=2490863 RepID=A0A455SQS5_9CHLR|nr:hypothetical protein KTC_47170 [Thermosporothrix sp. COM3]